MQEAGYLKCIRAVVNTFLHQLIAVIAVYNIWTPLLNSSSLLSWHVILCSLGLFPLMAEGMILFHKDNVYNTGLSEEGIKRNHVIVMVVSVVFICGGVGIEIARRGAEEHFVSAHAIVGLLCLIILLLATISGAVTSIIQALKTDYRPIALLIHNILGILSYIFTVASLCTGYFNTPFFFQSEESKIGATVVSVVICLWSLVYSFISITNQIKQMIK
ncbi:PREDICTED: uncharacterized protein LOC108560482 [Nicrophorus vespilloides]|uniref:ascorbate ferrireductase (transmembrane) n=1 Tax=Nicrophorus vespilloides TaxID=110193 RepID=A0ABM1MG36_NICVS|nr:PREDICTED: uncharacterized protein LOC108560482 [Nicrophorus vespilloides]